MFFKKNIFFDGVPARRACPPPPKKKKIPFHQNYFFFFFHPFAVDLNLRKLSPLLIGHNKHTQSVEGRMINTGWKKNKPTKYFVKRLLRQSALFTLPCQLDDTQTANVFLSAASCLRSLFVCKGISQGLNKRLRMNEDHLQSVFSFWKALNRNRVLLDVHDALKVSFGPHAAKKNK